jgi:hypothetical protein
MSGTEVPPREETKTELLRRNRRAFEELEDLLRPLDDARLTAPGKDGWAIKDHLAHLAAWQMGITSLLQHGDRFRAMGLEHSMIKGKSEDEINQMIYERSANLSAAEAWDRLRSAYREMEAVLESLDNEDLFTPYTNFLPEGKQGSTDPILNWIVGNAGGHYEEHIGWIRAMLSESY